MVRSVLLIAASALLYCLAFPPLSLGPVAWLALVPLLVAAARLPPAKAAGGGLLWGVAIACGVGSSLPGMVSHYFELPAWIGWGVFAAVGVALSGIYYAAFAAWVSWLARRSAASPLAIAAGWGACEFARAHLVVGNPWALSAYSQVGFTPLMQIADASGPYGPGMLLAAVNAALAALLCPSLRTRRPARSMAAVGAALAAVLIYGGIRMRQSFSVGEPIEVAAVQGAVERGMRWKPEYQGLGIAEYVSLTDRVAARHPALVVWPEYAINFYLDEPTRERRAVLDGIRPLGADLILGGPHYAFTPSGATVYHNSIYLIRHDGVAARYDKMRLLPLAEGEFLGHTLESRSAPFTPGQAAVLLPTSVGRVGAFVCFEAMYPELVRRFADAGAEILANLSNDDWFGSRAAARHHLAIASVRAIENRRFLVRATSNGYSAIIDPHGRIVSRSGFGDPEVLTAVIYRSTTKTPYQRWGDAVAWLAIAVCVLVAFRSITHRPGTAA